ncbi:type I-E CRISPR-associated protein Cas7/Cse4/CasC [Lactobacillus sp. ESL0679]|uniref:type I-E CRISPR-associated protein Cas7/Cse4/CasC n=1 Tax=Lactobacillus sp. ESL0679 TaxID=2983209 RepID=UPI0023F9B0F6|nr:type I-E CRISPR-associated protein Cas7/Cse4/CasC [Lactobacillus sp. ESL0679]MDF7682367.1 type I-E CRISPR-associated protein Cas7/Cse4/CasC [Lactobacillus sp. ESL0679]
MSNTNLYLDLNILQKVPSSNINQDSTGAAKTAFYGGVTRARVSAQNWQKAVYDFFKAENAAVAIKTKEVAELLAYKLTALDGSLDANSAIDKSIATLGAAGLKFKRDQSTGRVLTDTYLIISPDQIEKLAQYALTHDNFTDRNAKNDVTRILQTNNSLDLALFGRIVADNPRLNVSAAAQVAHAISTHEIKSEYDYFTAFDDSHPDKATDVDMLGAVEYDSAILYRYANVSVNTLANNLNGGDIVKSVAEFVKAFILSMPTSTHMTFANKTLPNYIMITLREDTPINLASAFEEPIISKKECISKSITRLEDEYMATKRFVEEPLMNVILTNHPSRINNQASNLSDLLKQVTDALTKAMQSEDVND